VTAQSEESTGTRRDEGGASLVEYALLIALIAIAALVAITFFGSALGGSYSMVGSSVGAA
jgi:Flp pilus assembly pilin Flp